MLAVSHNELLSTLSFIISRWHVKQSLRDSYFYKWLISFVLCWMMSASIFKVRFNGCIYIFPDTFYSRSIISKYRLHNQNTLCVASWYLDFIHNIFLIAFKGQYTARSTRQQVLMFQRRFYLMTQHKIDLKCAFLYVQALYLAKWHNIRLRV
jgi:hypothetical protein